MPIDVVQWRVRIGLFHSEGAYREMKRRCGRKHQKIKIKSLVGDVTFVVAVALLAVELIRAMMLHSITVLSRLQWKDVTESFHTTLSSLHSQWQQQDDKPSVSCKSTRHSRPNLITDLPSLTAVCVVVLHSVVRMLLLLSGDVERNPGPQVILNVGDLPTLTNILEDAASKWTTIGDQLGFTDGELRSIRSIPQCTTGGDQSCFRELLAQWLKWAPPKHELPTLEKIASALREAKEERLAYDLPQNYQEKKAAKDNLPQSPTVSTDGESPHGASATGNERSQSPDDVTDDGSTLLHTDSSRLSHGQTRDETVSEHLVSALNPERDTGVKDQSGAGDEGQCLMISVTECKAWIIKLRKKLQNLVGRTLTVMKDKKVDLSDACLAITDLPMSLRDESRKSLKATIPDLAKATSLNELFYYLNSSYCWNYLNFDLLWNIVDFYGDDETKQMMEAYDSEVKDFRKRTSVRVFWEASDGKPTIHPEDIPPNVKEYTVKRDWSPDSKTLEDVEKLREETACELYLYKLAIHVYIARPNTVEVTFLVPSFALEDREHVTAQTGAIREITEHPQEEVRQVERAPRPLSPEEELPVLGSSTAVKKTDHPEDPDIQQQEDSEEKVEGVPEAPPTGGSKEDVTTTATESLLRMERNAKEELQQQLVEKEQRAKQAEMTLDLERDEFTAALEQREAQMERERKRVEELQLELEKVQKENAEKAKQLRSERDELTAALQQREAQVERERKKLKVTVEAGVQTEEYTSAMARQPHPQRGFSYQNVEIFRNEENTLGIGSYGAVYRAKCDELPCAAKLLHPVFFQFNDPGMLAAVGKFEQECDFLSMVRHPNIIQYLGMIRDPDSGRPVLLMELMDESLTRFLERQNGPLPYHVQVNLVYDITLALAYLHFNRLVHRDLSSNNVLLIAGSRAKVTDFGMSKLIDVNPRMTPLTQVPGTSAYMPPEALLSRPRYTGKLDCFSDGVLMIQIMTRKFPEPGPNMREIKDSRSPTGVIHIPVSEVERRRNHIDLIDPTHPLLPIALDCLNDRESERPSARELCHHIAALKEAPQYAESVQQASERSTESRSIATEEEGHQQILQQSQQIREQEHQIQHLRQQAQAKDITIATNQRQIQSLNQQLQSCNEQLQSQSDQLQASKSINLTWREGGKAPCAMYRGADAVEGSVAYFKPHVYKEVHTYDSEKEEWSQLPDCPNLYFSLAVVKGMVTTIGGEDSARKCTDILLSLTGQGRDRKWTDRPLPSMPTKRKLTTAACIGNNLIVAGGQTVSGSSDMVSVSTVEVMDTENLQWYTATSLPHPLDSATATICGDKVYLLGGRDQKYAKTKSVLTCSLTALRQSCQPWTWKARFMRKTMTREEPTPNIWHTVADIPMYGSSCTTLRGELVAVGGHESDYEKKTTAVYQYSPSTDSWQVISHMKTARSDCLVAAFPNNKLIVVGGCTHGDVTDVVEIAL